MYPTRFQKKNLRIYWQPM